MTWIRGVSKNRGETNPGAKLKAQDVLTIRKMRQGLNRKRMPSTDPRSVTALAKAYGVAPCVISHICHGYLWGHL